MNPLTNIINKFEILLPVVRNWIDELLNANQGAGVSSCRPGTALGCCQEKPYDSTKNFS